MQTDHTRGHDGLSALVLGCVGLAVVPTAPSAAAEQGATAFTIRSSLAGKTALPRRIAGLPTLGPGALPRGGVPDRREAGLREPREPFAFGADGRDEATRTMKTATPSPHGSLREGIHSRSGKALVAGARTTATKTGRLSGVGAHQLLPRNWRGMWQRQLENAVRPDPNVLHRSVTAQPGLYRITADGASSA